MASVAYGFLSLGWQLTKPLEPFSELLLLIRRQLTPLLKSLRRLLAFFLTHVRPLTGSIEQAFLSLGRNLIPMIAEPLKHLLFLLV